MCEIRLFEDEDRDALAEFGVSVNQWWRQAESLHVVAGRPAIGDLQIVDRDTTSTRRPGRIEMLLSVAPEHRRQGVGSRLFQRALDWARQRDGTCIYTSYVETHPCEPGALFLEHRQFEEFERFCPSRLDVQACDLSPFAPMVERLQAQGLRFLTYADVADSQESRRRLFDLESNARLDIPVRDTGAFEPEPFESWNERFDPGQADRIVLGEIDRDWVAMTTLNDWGFTCTRRGYRGRGIATAVKVHGLQIAKARGVRSMETENHFANAPILAINRKLGYEFGPVDIACVRWL